MTGGMGCRWWFLSVFMLLLGGGAAAIIGAMSFSFELQPAVTEPAGLTPVTTYTFEGVINFDQPTPNPPVPFHQFTLAEDGTIHIVFAISSPREKCGLWWRIDALDHSTYYFGGHFQNTASIDQYVFLPANHYQLQVGASINDRDCTGTQAYSVVLTIE